MKTKKKFGVVIPNKKLPKNGRECYLAEVKNTPDTTIIVNMLSVGAKVEWFPELYCVLTNKDCSCTTRPNWCPLKQIEL